MSKKDFDKYYEQLTNQYLDIKAQLDEFEKVVESNMVEPERLDMLKKTFQPIIDNYKMITWVSFLLNKPVKKKKQYKYIKQHSSKLDDKFSPNSTVKNGEAILQTLNKEIHKDDI